MCWLRACEAHLAVEQLPEHGALLLDSEASEAAGYVSLGAGTGSSAEQRQRSSGQQLVVWRSASVLAFQFPMPRPATKRALMLQSRHSYEAMIALVVGLSPTVRDGEFVAGTMNRNIRDVFGHLHHWHLLLLGWYAVGMPAVPEVAESRLP